MFKETVINKKELFINHISINKPIKIIKLVNKEIEESPKNIKKTAQRREKNLMSRFLLGKLRLNCKNKIQ